MIPGCILPNWRSCIFNDFGFPAAFVASLGGFIA